MAWHIFDKKGSHINGLEGFWEYPKRDLTAKGCIRKESIPLCLSEYIWQFNHRNLSINEQG
ncbi:MAG TPA: hypothetical protein ACFYEJ_05250 [Candidatus Wujingus californicus]